MNVGFDSDEKENSNMTMCKRQWYEDNGYLDRLITSEDGPDGSISSAEIERIARKHILMEDDE